MKRTNQSERLTLLDKVNVCLQDFGDHVMHLVFDVSGSDAGLYPPMSHQLEAAGIDVSEGYQTEHLADAPDLVVVGNVMSRGNPMVEHVLERGLPYVSGPEFLARYILQQRWVLAVAGTHGKTSTASLLAWILEHAGLAPGFLIGGVPENFGLTARLGDAPFFVVEADEYDTAFFDKRSKFLHYHPRTLIINNLEFDHADIFADLADIQRQFHHLVRTVPGNGLIIAAADDPGIDTVLEMGCWSALERFCVGDGCQALWQAAHPDADAAGFELVLDGKTRGRLRLPFAGLHNIHNTLAAIAAARHAGVPVSVAMDALQSFRGVRRRMQLRGEVDGIRVYDDFAHHPTAINLTLQAARSQLDGTGRIIAVLEPRSNTMRMGVYRGSLAGSLTAADVAFLYQPAGLSWSLQDVADEVIGEAVVYDAVDALVAALSAEARHGDRIIIMSNGGFGGIHEKLLNALGRKAQTA